MNVVLYCETFLPTLGGREFVVHHLANSLAGLGHSVRVLGPAGAWTHRKLKLPYPVHRWPRLRALREPMRLVELALDTAVWGCDVIHAHMTYPSGYTALRMKRLRNFPLVITPHGVDLLTIPELDFGKRLDPELDAKIGEAVRGADRVTAISRAIEAALVDIGAEPGRVRFVPNGVDIARFERSPPDGVRKQLGFDAESRLVVSVGKYNRRKGFEFLVRAMPLVLAAEPRARLVIVGEFTDPLRPLIGELGLESKVTLTGGLPPPRGALIGDFSMGALQEPDPLVDILRSADVYVSAGTEINAEGLSLSVLEGLAAGLPVAGTAVSGNVDVVVEGENGALAEPADERSLAAAILRVLGAPDRLRSIMRAAARETASRYAWERVARQYVEVYEQAVASARQAR